jgi:hypothetical protein
MQYLRGKLGDGLSRGSHLGSGESWARTTLLISPKQQLSIPLVFVSAVGQKGRVLIRGRPEKADSRYQVGTLIAAVGFWVT